MSQLPNLQADTKNGASQVNWVQLLKAQARITAVAPVEALNALSAMLPDSGSRERALALSAAVLMIEPTLANPRSEIISFLIDTLGVDPQRVIGLARQLTDALEAPPLVPAASTSQRKAPAKRGPKKQS